MALTNFQIKLFKDQYDCYRVAVTSTFQVQDMFKENGCPNIPSCNDPSEDISMTLSILSTSSQPQNPIVHSVQLGEIQFDELTIYLDGPEGNVTSGTVRSVDAESETRPWK